MFLGIFTPRRRYGRLKSVAESIKAMLWENSEAEIGLYGPKDMKKIANILEDIDCPVDCEPAYKTHEWDGSWRIKLKKPELIGYIITRKK